VYDFKNIYTSGVTAMRTNIDIDDELMAAAMQAGGYKTKKEAVEEGLRLLRRRKVYEGLLALRGQLEWDDSDAAWAKPAVVPQAAAPRKPYGAAVTAKAAKPAKSAKPATKPARRSKSA
jgi:Arc/MetJ family transcription regulator